YKKIRLLENALLVLPFSALLALKDRILLAIILLLLSACMSFLKFKINQRLIIPVPLRKMSVEFIMGFRSNFWLILFLYIISAIAVSVRNFNLGMVSLLVLQLLCIGFFAKTEPVYFVWIYNS